MTRRVFRYFFDYIDGQEKWLNEMSEQGWRLVKCGQLSYVFENCEPGEYEYAVDFVAEKSYSQSKDYKMFLENMGYKTFYKNVNVGIYIGKVSWRPWGEGAGQITTAPGSYQKELIIAEKKKDGKAFELHTDLTDSMTKHNKILVSYLWAAISMLALAVMCAVFAIILSPFALIGTVICGAFGVLWLKPALRLASKVRRLMEEAETSEYEAPSVKKKVLKMIMIAAIPVLIVAAVFGTLYLAEVPFDSYSARNMVQTSWGSQWNARYGYLDGYKQRRVTLDEGSHIFTVEITTESGELSLSITGQDGTEYYKASALQTSSFVITVELAEKEKLTIRVDTKEHCGGYNIRWE